MSVKLLNTLDPEGEFLKFYTELDINVDAQEKVFIVGGNYDNTVYTDATHPLYNPYHPFAAGYTVLSVDKTINSNAITLNIKYAESRFSAAGVASYIFEPKPVYKVEEELLIDPNQVREAYLTKTYFKRGEFNGGKFQDGIFGEYNIQGDANPAKPYQRQHFVDLLKAKYQSADPTKYQQLSTTDYSCFETPVRNAQNKAIFNNNYYNNPAEFSGIFLGGNWNWGAFKSRTEASKAGKRQLLDGAGMRMEAFSDNNNGNGYNLFVSGNFGRIFTSGTPMRVIVNATTRQIKLAYVPFELITALDAGFTVQVQLYATLNTRALEVTSLTTVGADTFLNIAPTTTYATKAGERVFEQRLFEEDARAVVNVLVRDSERKHNRFHTGKVLSADWFAGTVENGTFLGGDWHGGEFRKGSIGSSYQRMTWYDGYMNGAKENTFAQDLRWKDGQWFDGNWRGDVSIAVRDLKIKADTIEIRIESAYKHLIQIGEPLFVSYLKQSFNNEYFDNYTDLPNSKILNSQSFDVLDIVDDHTHYNQVTLVVAGVVESIANVNLKNAKVSQSHFQKGTWHDGAWDSGLRKVRGVDVLAITSLNVSTRRFSLDLAESGSLRVGDFVQLSNVQWKFEVDGELAAALAFKNRFYFKPADELFIVRSLATVDSASGATLRAVLDFPEIQVSSDAPGFAPTLLDLVPVNTANSFTRLYNATWLNGEFRAGVWHGGLWNNGHLKNNLYFDLLNTQHQSIWQAGYWRAGTFEKGAFLSGVWEYGTWRGGTMTNLYGNTATNSVTGWNAGDSVWLGGVFESGKWKGGVWKNGRMNSGTILNGSIENINWISGTYDNGLGLYNIAVNANRSGKYSDEKTKYDQLSAPSVIYIDGDGWVQLDQPSFYQKDYNVIFQDLDTHKNPFANQMFDVKERDQYGTRLRIDYASNGVDNPVMQLSEFAGKSPLLATDQMKGVCEVSKTADSHRVWLLDAGHNRILDVDVRTNKVDVIGRILNQPTKDIYTFAGLKAIAGAGSAGSGFVYVLDADLVLMLKVAKNTTGNIERDITSLVPTLLENETLVDIFVTAATQAAAETVFVLSSFGNLYYTASGWEAFKVIPLGVVSATTKVAAATNPTSSTIHLFVSYNNGAEQLKHYILDYAVADAQYAFRTNALSIAGLNAIVNTNPVKALSAAFVGDNINLWLNVVEQGADHIYLFEYKDYFTNVANAVVLLNSGNAVDFPVASIQMGWNNEYLLIIGDDPTGYPVYLASAELNKTNAGFSNQKSSFKLLNIYQNLDKDTTYATRNYNYFYYDTATEPVLKRLISVRDGQTPLYNPVTGVDMLSASDELVKMINGGSESEMFSIVRRGSSFLVRRSVFDSTEAQSTYYKLETATTIHDISYSRNTLFIAADFADNKLRVISINSFVYSATPVIVPVTAQKYHDTGFVLTSAPNAKVVLDVIENKDGFLAVLYRTNTGFYQLNIGNNSVDSRRMYANTSKFNGIVDVALCSKGGKFILFVAYAAKIYRLISDVIALDDFTAFWRWTQFSELTDNDLVYTGKSVTDVYRTVNNDRLVVKNDTKFDVLDAEYQPNTFDLNVVEFAAVSPTQGYVLSNQMLLSATMQGSQLVNVRETGLGHYKQNGRLSFTTPVDKESALNNPLALTYAPAFNSAGDDYMFFLDNTVDTDVLTSSTRRFVRYYNINRGVYGIVKPYTTLGDVPFYDLCYNTATKEVYALRDLYVAGVVRSSLVKFKWGGGEIYESQDVNTLNSVYRKFALNAVGGVLVGAFTDRSATKVDVVADIDGTGAAGRVGTVVTGSEISNVAFSTLNGIQRIYYTSNKVVYLITSASTTPTALLDPNSWSSPQAIGQFDKVNFITEYNDSQTQGLLINDTAQRAISVIQSNSVNQPFTLSDFTFAPGNDFIANSYVFLYATNATVGKGIIRQPIGGKFIDIRANNMVHDSPLAASATMRKIIAVSATQAYALFDDKIYKYNFVSQKVSLVSLESLKVSYRDALDAYPTDLSGFRYVPVDIALLSYTDATGAAKTSLLVTVAINNNGNVTGSFDLFSYNGSSFSKQGLDYLYTGSAANKALSYTGGESAERTAASPAGVGGVKFLFKSGVAPKVVSHGDVVTIYMGADTATAQLVKIKRGVNTFVVVPNAVNTDLVYKVSLPAALGESQYVRTVTLLDAKGVAVAATSALSVGSYLLAGEDVLAGATPQDFVAVFVRDNTSTVSATANYTMKVSFILARTASVLSKPMSDTNAVFDVKPYATPAGVQAYALRNQSESPLSTDLRYERYWTLTRLASRYDITPNVAVDAAGSEQLVVRYPFEFSVQRQWSLPVGTTNYNGFSPQLGALTLFKNAYSFNSLVKGYRVASVNPQQVLSPYLTSRVLYETYVQDGVNFNVGGSVYSAHVVSTRWKNKLFLGSWDAPFYHNHNVLAKSSIFLSGIFEGVFYDGYMLGGSFRNNAAYASVVKQGHFRSDYQDINFESGAVNSEYRYDIKEIGYVEVKGKSKLALTVEAVELVNGAYVNVVGDQISKGRVIHLPTLFKSSEYTVVEILKTTINLNHQRTIVLKVERPALYRRELFLNQLVFVSITEYAEYLFGEQFVIDVYDDAAFVYLVVASEFDAFTNGRYVPVVKPKLLNNVYKRIEASTLVQVDGNTYSHLQLDLLVPDIYTANDFAGKYNFVQNYYLSDNVQIIKNGKYAGKIQIPDYLQLFTLTFMKSYKDAKIQFTSVAKNLYLSNITTKNNSSSVSIKLDAPQATVFARDILVNNSYVTTPASRGEDWVENSIFLSGRIDRHWKSGAWLNTDARGFANGTSTFGNARDPQAKRFEGAAVPITGISFESDEFVWVELQRLLPTVKTGGYICLRGFTGSKSVLIGAERSSAFRILDVNETAIKITNPFKYFSGTSNEEYFNDFQLDALHVRTQDAAVKLEGANRIELAAPNVPVESHYGYASISAWNGGDFYGDFSSVWNAGNFRNGTFSGKWFGSAENYHWQGDVALLSSVTPQGFLVTLDVTLAQVRVKDLVYVRLNPVLIAGQLQSILDGFYAPVLRVAATALEAAKLVVKYPTDVLMKNGAYNTSLTRYRVHYDELDYANAAILDYNSNRATTSVAQHSFMDVATNVTPTTNIYKTLVFDGNTSLNTLDLLGIATHQSPSFSLDLWFSYDDDVVDAINPIISFHNAALESKAGVKLFVRARQVWVEYNGSDNDGVVETMLFDAIVTSRWYHLGVFVTGQTLDATLFEQDMPAMLRVTKPFRWEQQAYDINYIGKGLFRNGANVESYAFKGRIDELRVWSVNLLTTFFTPNLADSWFNRKFVNRYIPELVAYYSGDDQADVASLYPDQETYAFLSESIKQDVVLNEQREVFTYAGKNVVVAFDLFLDKPRESSPTYNSSAKLLTLLDRLDVTTSTDTEAQFLDYHLELFVTNTSGTTYLLTLRESVTGASLVEPLYTETTLGTDTTLPYWSWTNLILENGTIYVNGKLLANFNTYYHNCLAFTKNTRLVLGAYPVVLDLLNKANPLNTPYSVTGAVRRFSVFENTATSNDYLTYRIKSAETTAKYALTTSVLAANTTLESASHDNIIIPTFKADGSNLLNPDLYAAETATYDIRGALRTNHPLSYNRTSIAEVVDGKLVRTDTLATALPEVEWLEGTFTRETFTAGAVVSLSVPGMANFTFFGKKMANASGTVTLHLHKNGYLSFNGETADRLALQNLFSNVPGATGYELFSASDLIQVLHTNLNYAKGGYIEYADRAHEFVLKIYAPNAALTPSEGAYNYVALRIDKVNSNILFYNRMIRELAAPYQKYQGLVRSDGKISTVKDPNATYYKNPAEPTDFAVGYVGSTAAVQYADNIEYLLYVPRYQNTLPDKTYVQHLYNANYDALAAVGIQLLTRYAGAGKGYFTFATVEDFPITLTPYYYQTLSNVRPYTASIEMKRSYSDTFVAGQNKNAVPRFSYFFDGEFTGSEWFNGVMVNGRIRSNDFVWKYGIKYNGSIAPKNFRQRITAASFITTTSNDLYDRNALYNKAVMVNREGDTITGIYLDLAAGSYAVALSLKTTDNLRNEALVVVSLRVNSVHSNTGMDTVLTSRVLKNTDFVAANAYQLIDLELTLDKAQKGVEIVVEYVATSFTQLLLDYVLVGDAERVQPLVQANHLHWLGGFHEGSDASTCAELTWYRGNWNGGTWKSGHWFALDKANAYYPETTPTVPNNAWSVWQSGKWSALSPLYALNQNPYHFDLQASVWHGGTWNSAVVPGSRYSYEATKFESHVLQDNTVLQLPAVRSTWLGGQWLRGEWNGGIFANGFWHSVVDTKPATKNAFAYAGAVSISAFDLKRLIFVDETTGYAVGQSGTVLKTKDAGASWTRQLSNTSKDLRDVVFLDELNGIVIGKAGTILRTADAGATWFATTLPGVTADLVSVHFLNVEVGFIVGGTSVLRSTDSGQTWANVTTKTDASGTYTMTGRMNAIAHSPNGNVYLVGEGGKGYVSHLGDKWLPLALPTNLGILTDVYFTDDNTGVIVGDAGLVLKTSNALTWVRKATHTTAAIASIHFVDKFTAYAVANAQNSVLETNDGGETWFVTKLDVPVRLNCLTMINSSKQFIVGAAGKLLRSTGDYLTRYESRIGNFYDISASTWNKGQMLNSIWEGGRVSDNLDAMETVFGDVVSQFKRVSHEVTNKDFVWNHPYQFKKYDLFNNRIFSKILGKDFFIGYHSGTGAPAEVEVQRVRKQNIGDGIAAVYWKRGEWNNGLFQFSHWSNESLDAQDITTVSIAPEFNASQFKAGLFYSSYWKGGLYFNKASGNSYPLPLDHEPTSLFYYSQWEKGYWKSSIYDNGLVSDDINDTGHVSNGMFLRSIWSAGVWEGGLHRLSLWRSGVNKPVNVQYKGTTLALRPVANPLDSSMATTLLDEEYPNFDVIGRLSNVTEGEANTLLNPRDAVTQPLVTTQKKYVLNRNNTISVFNIYNVLVASISLDFGELYAEVFLPASGSNIGVNIPSATVTALRQEANILWVGTSAGLWKFDTVTKFSIDLTTELPNPYVTSLHTTETRLWAGTRGGIYVRGNVTGTPGRLTVSAPTTTGDAMPSNNITALHGNDTTMYFGTNAGVWVVSIASATARMLTATNFIYQGTDIPAPLITALYTNGERVWVGTNSGVWLLNVFNGQLITQLFTSSTTDGVAGEQLPSNRVTSITQYGNTMWVGTDAGLWRMTPR